MSIKGKGKTTVSNLSMNLLVSQPTISDSIFVLEKVGPISTVTDDSDRRRLILSLTEKGDKIVEEINSCARILGESIAKVSEKEKLVSKLMDLNLALFEAGMIPEVRMCLTCIYLSKEHLV